MSNPIAKIAFYDDASPSHIREIMNTGLLIRDQDDTSSGGLNQSLIMLSHRLEKPLELLEKSIERIEWV